MLAAAMTRAEPAVVSRYAAAVPRVVLAAEGSAVMMVLCLALGGRLAVSAQSRAALTGPEHRPALPESEVGRRCHPHR
jgi:hypothetical protein